MADFTSADDELQHLQQLDRASEQLVQNLEGMLDKFKVLNEGAKGTLLTCIPWIRCRYAHSRFPVFMLCLSRTTHACTHTYTHWHHDLHCMLPFLSFFLLLLVSSGALASAWLRAEMWHCMLGNFLVANIPSAFVACALDFAMRSSYSWCTSDWRLGRRYWSNVHAKLAWRLCCCSFAVSLASS